ncbi:MAG: hypothetical protein ACXVZW_10175 [Gaiellaceae bacterium]
MSPRLRRLCSVSVEAMAALALASGLAVVLTWPLALHPGRYLLGSSANDGTGGVAWLWELRREGGYHVFGIIHHTLTGAPIGWAQGNALNLQWLVPYLPAYLLSGSVGEVTAFNLVTLAGLALSGASMYALVRWLDCGRLVAAWAGFVFILFPWHLDRAMAGHGSLVHIEVFPLFILAFLAWLRRPTWVRLALVALATSVVWLTAALFGIMLVVVTPALLAAVVWHDRREIGLRRACVRAIEISSAVAIGTGVVALLAIPGGSSGGLGNARPQATLYGDGARLQGFFSRQGLAQSETRVYLGWVTIILAVGWLVVAVKRWDRLPRALRLATTSLTAMSVLAFAFSLSNPLPVAGLLAHPMPSWFLWKLVPQFRIPARFVAVVMAGLVPLAALGLQALVGIARARARPWLPAGVLATALCLGAVVVSSAELSVQVFRQRVDRLPAEYSALAATASGVLVEYPLEPPGIGRTLTYLFWQRVHGRPLLNGAADGTPADDVRRAFTDPCARGAAESLAFLDVTAIITRPNTYGDFPSHNHLPAPISCGPGYRIVKRLADGTSVWRVIARPAPAVAVFRGADFGQPDLPQGRFVSQRLDGDTGRIDLYVKTPGLWRLRLPTLSQKGERLVVSGRDGARTFRPTSAQAVLVVPLILSRGHSRLLISVSPPTPEVGGAGVFLGTPSFAPASPADRLDALRPLRLSSELPFR